MGELSAFGRVIVELLFLIIVLAIVAVIISNKSGTARIIQSAGSLFTSLISNTTATVKGN